MALTTDDLLVKVTVDQTGAIKGFKALDDSLAEIAATAAKTGKSSEEDFKALDAATISVIASTQALAASMENAGKTSYQLAQDEAAARVRQLGDLKEVLSLNSQLTNTMAAQIEAAQKAAQAFAQTKAMKDNADLAKALAVETRAIGAETEKLGKTTQQLADIEKRESLARVEQIEKQLIGEGRLTQALSAQLDAQRKAIVVRAQTKVSDADAKAMTSIGTATKDASSSMVSWAAAVTLANQGIEVATKLVGFLRDTVYDAVKAFALSRDNVTRLGATMSILGDKDVQGSVDHFRALARELDETTTATKGQVLQLAALGRQMGLSNDKTDQLVKTAIDLAAAYNEDVGTAFDQLSQSLKGQVRGLALLRPELAGAAKDWLQAGGAVTYFSDLLKGRGEAELNTFGGKLKQNEKIFDEFKKAVGEGILVGLGIDPSAPSEIQKLAGYIDDVKDSTATVTNFLKNFGLVALDVAKAVGLTFSTVAIVIKNAFLDTAATIKNNLAPTIQAAGALMTGNVVGAVAAFSKLDVATGNSAAGAAYMGKKFDETLTDLRDRLTGAKGGLDSLSVAMQKVNEQQRTKPPKPPKAIDEAATKEAAKLLEELGKTINRLGAEAAKIGANEYDVIRQKANAETRDLQIQADKLRAAHALNDAAKAQLKLAQDLIKEAGHAAIQELVQKKIGDAKAANFALDVQILQALGNQEEAERLQTEAAIAKLAVDLQDAELQGSVTEALQEQLKIEIEKVTVLKQQADIKKTLNKVQAVAAAVGSVFGDEIIAAMGTVIETAKVFGKEIDDETKATLIKAAAIATVAFAPIRGIFETAAALFSPEAINNLADTLDQLQKLPEALVAAFNKLGAVIDSLVKNFPKALDSLIQQMPSLVQKILDAIPGLVDKMIEGLHKILDMLPGIFQRIIDKLPAIVEQLAKALPGLIKQLMSAIGDILASITEAIPEILKNLVDHLPDVIEAFVEGLIAAMGKVVSAVIDSFSNGGAERLVGSIIRALPKLYVAIYVGIYQGLLRAVKEVFEGVHIKMPGGDLAKNIQDSVKKIGDIAGGVGEQVFKVIDVSAQAKAKSVGDDLRSAIQSATDEMRTVSEGLWARLKELWQWVKDHIMDPIIGALTAVWTQFVKPIVDLLISGLTNVWNNIIKPIIDSAIAGLKATWDLLGKLWTDTIKPLVDGLVSGLQSVWATFKQISETLVAGLSSAWAALQKLWDTSVKPVVDTLAGVAKDIGGAVGTAANGLKQGLTDGLDSIKTFFSQLLKGNVQAAFKSTLDYLTALPTTLASGMKEKFLALTQDLKDLGGKLADSAVSGLLAGVQSFKDLGGKIWEGLSGGLLNGAQTFRDMGSKIWEGLQKGLSSVSGGGGAGGILKAVGLAAGGMIAPTYAASGVYVMAPKGIDTVPIMAATDESVLNRRATANLGGKQAIDALNAGQMLGQRQPAPAQQNVEQHFEINVKVDGSKAINEKDLADKIMEKIKADSYAGIHIMSTKGLRS